MKTATFVKEETNEAGAHWKLYRIDPPLKYGGEYEGDESGVAEYVRVSAVSAMFSGPETYIFPADAEGEVIDWAELDGSYRGGFDHERALRDAGYEVTDQHSDKPAEIIAGRCSRCGQLALFVPHVGCEKRRSAKP